MEDLKYWIWFSRLENLTPKKQFDLIRKFESPKVIFNKSREELVKYDLKKKDVEELTKLKYRINLDKYVEYMQKNEIQTITINDIFYPERLKQIYDPPVVLFLKGNKTILNDTSIAIVGCRMCTSYGSSIAKKIAYNLSLNSINVISGLAKGIDKSAHMGALSGNAKTIGIMGCGLDRVYPEENTALFEEILKTGGAVISEYVIGTKPNAKNFPRRNRIISGMSNGVLVVEAKEKSGTLMTVDFALEQGKNLYVIPGNINSPNSYGTNELIKQGAKVVTDVEDVLEDFRTIFYNN